MPGPRPGQDLAWADQSRKGTGYFSWDLGRSVIGFRMGGTSATEVQDEPNSLVERERTAHSQLDFGLRE